jgi:hypothetical protein
MSSLVGDLGRVFQRRDARGHRIYSEDDVRACLFQLALEMGPRALAAYGASAEVLLLIGEYGLRIGLRPGQSAEDARRAVDRYFGEHPVRVDLRAEVDQVLLDSACGAYSERSLSAGRSPALPAPALTETRRSDALPKRRRRTV